MYIDSVNPIMYILALDHARKLKLSSNVYILKDRHYISALEHGRN